MAPAPQKGYKPIKALALYEKGWTIKARLVRKEMKKQCKNRQTNFVMPLEFMDEEGTQITALVCGEAVDTLDKTMKENRVYVISNGEVKIAAKKYSSVKNDFSLMLDAKAKIEEVADDKHIKDKGFNFALIKNIANMSDGSMIDVLGIVVKTSAKQLHVPKKGKGAQTDSAPAPAHTDEKMYKRAITLCDESGMSIGVTMWRRLAEVELTVGQVVGLKRVKVSSFNEKQLNTIPPSEVVIDPADKRTEALKRM